MPVAGEKIMPHLICIAGRNICVLTIGMACLEKTIAKMFDCDRNIGILHVCMMRFQIHVHSLYYLEGLAMKHIESHCWHITDIISMPEVPDRHHKVNQNFFSPSGNYMYTCTIHMLKYTTIDGSYKRRMPIAGVNSNKSRVFMG
jgi:hypothetical protein